MRRFIFRHPTYWEGLSDSSFFEVLGPKNMIHKPLQQAGRVVSHVVASQRAGTVVEIRVPQRQLRGPPGLLLS